VVTSAVSLVCSGWNGTELTFAPQKILTLQSVITLKNFRLGTGFARA
jgi:hypothetical protein